MGLMKKAYTILVDRREQIPLLMPSHLAVIDRDRTTDPFNPVTTTVRIETRTVELLTGDYQLEGYQDRVIVERKASLSELWKNLLTPRGRKNLAAEMARLHSECSSPLIVVEGSPLELEAKSMDGRPAAFIIRDALMDFSLQHKVPFWLVPAGSGSSRRMLGEWVAAILISGMKLPPKAPPEISHVEPQPAAGPAPEQGP